MQPHLVAGDRDLDRYGERAAEFGIVVGVGEAIGAVRQGRDPGAHLALGIVLQGLTDREHGLGAVFATQRLHALHAETVRRHLRPQIGQPLARDLAIEQDQLLHVLLQFAGAIEADRRDAQPFLIDVGVPAIGEIGVMRGIDRPGDDPAIDEDRLAEHDVGQVGAGAGIGVVADEHVARLHLLDRVALQNFRDDADEAAEMHRDVLGLAQGRAARVEQRGRAVAALLDVGRKAGADQRFAHLLDDRGQCAADHLDRDRVDAVGGNCAHGSSSIRLR